MKNKFEATCHICGFRVAADAGDTNLVNGRWQTQHTSLAACRERQEIANQPRAVHMSFEDMYYDDDYWHEGTSEDVNPGEGDK